jgi:hypothetical protein
MSEHKSIALTPSRKVSDSLSLTFTKLRDNRIENSSGSEAENLREKLRIAKER